MNIILIGYRATGKTTVAQVLAERLGWAWTDADIEIERCCGKSIASVFAEEGEQAFRDWESRVIHDLCRHERLVVAAGGGAPLRPENRQAMRQSGQVVSLTASAETIFRRMFADATTAERRPSLTNQAPMQEILHLLALREPIYQQTAHLKVETDARQPADIADEIVARLHLDDAHGTQA